MFPNVIETWNSVNQVIDTGDCVPDSMKRPADYFIFRSELTTGARYRGPAEVIYVGTLTQKSLCAY